MRRTSLEQMAADNPRVLVVEDDRVSAKLIQRLFALQGLDADHAVNGAVGLKMHKEQPYRIVVSDWMMPEMDGVELCREFRRIAGAYVYFILCTAKHQKEDRIEAYESGVDDFLTKPLERYELQARLKVARRILSTEDALQKQNMKLEATASKLIDSNHELAIASKRFQDLFRGLPVACFTFDQDGLIQEWNRAAGSTFGIPADFALDRPVWDVLGDSGCIEWTRSSISAFFRDESNATFDWEYGIGSDHKHLACNVICLRDDANQPIGAISANLDITERKLAEQRINDQMVQLNHFSAQLNQQKLMLEQMNARLNHLAITDGLTGLWNHRRFQELLEESVDMFNRTAEPFSLILLDIDFFKRVNDEFGHQVGDEVLQAFAHTLKEKSRSHELPARYGGEEFAIILRKCGPDQAIMAAERFREAVQNRHWKYRPMTASFGVTTCKELGANPKRLITQADRALYVAKLSGRNRSIHFQDLAEDALLSPHG